jgi:aspartyl-tRNA(Asn)/glutamyl-tRNA(Gln) amidotransferase subunit A
VDVEIEDLHYAVPAAWSLLVAEASEWHREFLREREHDYEPGTRAMLQRGLTLSAVSYVRALHARRRVQASFRRAFETHALDALVAPSIPSTAATIEAVAHELSTGEPGVMAAAFHHSVIANLVGVPALSVPCGFDARGLPIGLQILGRPFEELVLFQIGFAYTSVTDWRLRHPFDGPAPASRTAKEALQ